MPTKSKSLTQRGITQRDLLKKERLGERQTRRDMGIDALIKMLRGIEADLADRVQEIIDEEITAANIMERCRIETGVDIKDVLGIEG